MSEEETRKYLAYVMDKVPDPILSLLHDTVTGHMLLRLAYIFAYETSKKH